jgi:iron(III) transport system permease protein
VTPAPAVAGTGAAARAGRAVARALPWAPAAVVVAGVAVPLAYLVLRALEAEPAELAGLVFRWRNARLLGHTVGLGAAVLALASALAFPAALLVTRTNVPFARAFTLLSVLPLAIPGYVIAYAMLAATGPAGTLSQLLGVSVPRPPPFLGAWIALSVGTAPYLFLNLRAALLGLDGSLEDAARSLGMQRLEVARRVLLPQLRPAFLAGATLVLLHVLGDFGVVSLVRFETFSYAIYLQYAAGYDRVYAACLALMLLALTAALLSLEGPLLNGRRFSRIGAGSAPRRRLRPLGRARWAAAGGLALLGLMQVGVPIATVVDWLGRGTSTSWSSLPRALGDALSAAIPAALIAATLALSVAYLRVRRPSASSRWLERIAYVGYATPPLAFALAIVFFSLRAAPALYQTLALLVGAYALHFLPEALGPVRSALFQAPPRLEEAARALGRRPAAAFADATLPLLRRGLGAGAALVFLSSLKELPLTFLLSPLGFRTPAMGVWSATREALFASAAPYALALIVASSAIVALMLAGRGE